jgi:predicted nucleic acid-binding Zn ribbon protein
MKGNDSYRCDNCGKKFDSSQDLREHAIDCRQQGAGGNEGVKTRTAGDRGREA